MPEFTVLQTQKRQGTFISATEILPAGYTHVRIEADIPLAADYEDEQNYIELHLYRSTDGGQTWLHRQGTTWHGGYVAGNPPLRPENPMPAISAAIEPSDVGARFRGELSVSYEMRIGVALHVT